MLDIMRLFFFVLTFFSCLVLSCLVPCCPPGTAGQRCTTLRRLVLHEKIYDEFVAKLVAGYSKVRIALFACYVLLYSSEISITVSRLTCLCCLGYLCCFHYRTYYRSLSPYSLTSSLTCSP